MLTWVLLSIWLKRLTMVLLVLLSVWSVSLMIDRRKTLKSLKQEGELDEAKKLLASNPSDAQIKDWAAKRETLLAQSLRALAESPKGSADVLERSLTSFLLEAKGKMDKGLTHLASIGSNAPFIGLFGTVLGVITAFAELANARGGGSAVMGAIAEALIATALGLLVAMPAVVAYNQFNSRVRSILTECESIRDYFISRRAGG